MWQLRRCETLYKTVLQLSHRQGGPLRSVAPVTCTHLQLPSTASSYRHLSLVTSISVQHVMPVTATVLAQSGSAVNIRNYHATNVVQKDSQSEETPAPAQTQAEQPPTAAAATTATTAAQVDSSEPTSDEAAAAAATDASTAEEEEEPHPTDIQYSFAPPPPLSPESQAKVDGLFQEIIWLDMIEVHLLTQLVQEKLSGM